MTPVSIMQLLVALTSSVYVFWIMTLLVIAVALGTVRLRHLRKAIVLLFLVGALLVQSWSLLEYLLSAGIVTIQLTDNDSALFVAANIENEINGYESHGINDAESDVTSKTVLSKFAGRTNWRVTLISAMGDSQAGGNDVLVKVVDRSKRKVGVIFASGDHKSLLLNSSIIANTDNASLSNYDRRMQKVIAKYGLIRPYEPGNFRITVIALGAIIPLLFFVRMAVGYPQKKNP